ncbi:MAG: hypothetical protein ACJAS1_001737 [Oleiphilaceae bacterium]|jgi:hypothetical protein
MNDLLFTYYNQDELLSIVSKSFEVLSTLSYKNFEEDDLLLVVARLKDI